MKINIDKRKLWLLLIKKLNHFIHNLHVLSVISILIEEMKKDLIAGKEIRITNFGTFKLKQTNPKQFKNVVSGKMEQSKTKNKLELKLAKGLAKYIGNKIDEDMKDEYNANKQ